MCNLVVIIKMGVITYQNTKRGSKYTDREDDIDPSNDFKPQKRI